jgi:hypothetical protein
MRTKKTIVALVAAVAFVGAGVAQANTAKVARGSKVYIVPQENGIHTALAGAIAKKKVPVSVVTREEAADYLITVSGEFQKAGWARTIMAGGYARGDARASMTVEHRETGVVAFAYNADKGGAWKGIQSAAESCAKHLKNHIEKGK